MIAGLLPRDRDSENPNTNVSENDVHLSYLPLPHNFERMISNMLMSVGAHI